MRAKDNMRTAAEVLVDQLRIHGVHHVFCVPGESYLAVLDAFHDSDLDVTVCRQEGGACMMAEAVGKVTGRPGVCFVTRGPGATNASPGIHIARQDSTPLVMFVGQVGARHARARGVSGTRLPRRVRLDDQMGDRDRRSRRACRRSCRAPSTPPRTAGPVRSSSLSPRTCWSSASRCRTRRRLRWSKPRRVRTEMAKFAEMLAGARAPIMLLGGSRWSQAASDAVGRFAQKYSLPVATTFRRGSFVRPAASLLRRRSRHRSESETA